MFRRDTQTQPTRHGARLLIPLVLTAASVACCTNGEYSEPLGDGCSALHGQDDVVEWLSCSDDAGCIFTARPDGALAVTMCQVDGCTVSTYPDGGTNTSCPTTNS